jgi:hypothetical protein
MTWDRRISLIVSIVYLVVAISQYSRWPTLLGYLLLTLACIWFGDELGDYIGPAGRYHYIDKTTPGIIIMIFGWFLLFVPMVVYLLYRWR